MKTNKIINYLGLILFLPIVFNSMLINAQTKPQKARVSLNYYQDGNLSALNISGKYKEGKSYQPAYGLDLEIYQVFENDSLVGLGNIVLDLKGKGQFDISKVLDNNLESYEFNIKHKSSSKFKKLSKNLTIKPAFLEARLVSKDSTNIIKAKLTNINNEPIVDAELKVQLQRLFAPLEVGKGIYFTDKNGTINVPITNIMPGIHGDLNYEVLLDDSDDYGTIKSIVKTNIGKFITDQSTFDQRTMWSPPSKAPWFVLIIPNILILGIWGFLVLLVINLYRISKHKNT